MTTQKKHFTFCYAELSKPLDLTEWRIFGYDLADGRIYVNYYCGVRMCRHVLPCFFPDNFIFRKTGTDHANIFLRTLEAKIREKMRTCTHAKERKNVIDYIIQNETCEE